MDAAPTSTGAIRAAQYVRMSSGHQRYSIESQKSYIAQYALARGYEIVGTYADAGKSGLSLKGRNGLKTLLKDALNPLRGFDAVLIHDVSRWGRFRDPDEAAHYEYLCRHAGVAVVYCAEPFENDFSPSAGILKNLKRVMAHEFSRELSDKLVRAHLQQAGLGYKQGGNLIFGFRRQVVDANDRPKFVLRRGEQKAVKEDRVRIVLGTSEEREIVRRIFYLCVEDGLSLGQIAKSLRSHGIAGADGAPWTPGRVRAVLKSELCLGRYVYNRTSERLQSARRHNPESLWIRASTGSPSIISEEIFAEAQACLTNRQSTKLSSEKLLQDLRDILKTRGSLSTAIVDETPGIASSATYKQHFGSMSVAFRCAGYVKPFFTTHAGGAWTREEVLAELKRLHQVKGHLSCEMIEEAQNLPSYNSVRKKLGSMSEIYALIGVTPKTHGEIVKEAMARMGEKRRGLKQGPRRKHFSQEYLIRRLTVLLAKHGYLSAPLIKADATLPSVTTIIERFGSLLQAYVVAGWNVDHGKLATARNMRRYANAKVGR